MRILVVTDKYPPHVAGGAELSLHQLLKIIHRQVDSLLVAVLDGNVREIEASYEGINLVRLPSLGVWPPTAHRTFYARGVGPRYVLKYLNRYEVLARYLLKIGVRDWWTKLQRISDIQSIKHHHGTTFLPSFDDDLIAAGNTVSALSTVIKDFRPDLIHADNYRSILSVSSSDHGKIPFTAMVRDHRFFCMLNEQSANIKGKICSRCSFDCVDFDPLPVRNSVKRILSENREFRVRHLSRARKVVTTSEYLERQIKHILPQSKLISIGNPVGEVEICSTINQKIFRATPPEILIVGMVNANKGQARVVDWIQCLKERLDDFRFVIAGRGRLAEKLKKQAKNAGLQDYLHVTDFLGREEIYRSYARASVVLAPNNWPEPFGRVPLEAGIAKRPIVAYNVGGIGESVLNGETGYLITPQHETALLDAVVEVIRSPERAARMGERARAFILERYAAEGVAQRLFSVWQESSKETISSRSGARRHHENSRASRI